VFWDTSECSLTERLEEENCQGGLQQGNCLGSQIRDMTKNIGEDLETLERKATKGEENDRNN